MRNLQLDRFLSVNAANDFADILEDLGITGDLSAFKAEYILTCKRHRLSGGPILLTPHPPRLGRAENRSSFIQKIIGLTGLSRAEVEKLLYGMEHGTLDPGEEAILYSTPMSDKNIWVTWSWSTNGSAPPFSVLRSRSSYDLRIALGLPVDKDFIDKLPMITLEYGSHNVPALYRPTVADAEDYTRFVVRDSPPPKENDWYGLTVPWQDDPEKRFKTGDGTYPPKLPEALHTPVPFPRDIVCVTYTHA